MWNFNVVKIPHGYLASAGSLGCIIKAVHVQSLGAFDQKPSCRQGRASSMRGTSSAFGKVRTSRWARMIAAVWSTGLWDGMKHCHLWFIAQLWDDFSSAALKMFRVSCGFFRRTHARHRFRDGRSFNASQESFTLRNHPICLIFTVTLCQMQRISRVCLTSLL